ncbi:MAG TPA: helix-turn-helix domain-containing protein [candidate division Zixibacteria bacterium]|nr:helix-turn-helix domain-containing protein [candidate division Zixibacteria bacterium]
MLTYQPMKNSSRLSSEERRHAIVDAVRSVFAEKGFHGTTTRELAHAAGVSEALLYKHFPSKESLYGAMLDACAKGPGLDEFKRIMALEPSTSTLVVLVQFIITYFVRGCAEDPSKAIAHRLMLRSLLEDAEFVRLAIRQYAGAWVGKFEECLRAATEAGDVRYPTPRADLRGWFIHHIAVGLMLYLHPRIPAIDYRSERDFLVEQAVRFALLGAGLKEEAIARHYDPKALALLAADSPA